MKLHFLALVGFTFIAASLARAADYPFTESFTRTAAFKAEGELTLENVNGDVDIRTWDKNEILIEVEKAAKTEDEFKRIELQMDVSDARAAIKVRLPKRGGGASGNIRARVRFKVTVPATAALSKIATVNSSVSISGARAGVNASSVNGAVRADDVAGATTLETVNGAIDVTFDRVDAQQRLSFKTVNGKIVARLPKDAGVQLRSSVVNGHIDCAFPIEMSGKINGRNISGKIGDGRASLEATTVNGSIRIEAK